MNDKQLMAKWAAIDDPKKALAEIVEHSTMFYGDSYYRDLVNALMTMASRLSADSTKRDAGAKPVVERD